jgi:nucleoside-diphosphate-sugar epimerase
MRRAVITGATGFIGGALARRLLTGGARVYGVGRDAGKLEALKRYGDFVPVVADFEDYGRLHETIGERGFDVFYHFALKGGYGAAKKDYSLQLYNALGACKAAEAAVKIGCEKFVLAGSANEYNTINGVLNHELSLEYASVYSVCKLTAEMICDIIITKKNMGFNVGRIAVAYGEGDISFATVVHSVILQLLKNESPSLVCGNNFYDIIYISDIADAFVAIGNKGINTKRYYIGHRKLLTFKEIFTNIGQYVNPSVGLGFGAYLDSGELDYKTVDLDALYNDTGWEAKVDFKESILKTAEWIKSVNPPQQEAANSAG